MVHMCARMCERERVASFCYFKGECSSKVVKCVDSTQLLSSIESLFSSIARTSSITFQTKSGGKRDLRHNDDGQSGAGECGRFFFRRGGLEKAEEEGKQTEQRKQSRSVHVICPRTKDASRERTALFPVSPLCLMVTWKRSDWTTPAASPSRLHSRRLI